MYHNVYLKVSNDDNNLTEVFASSHLFVVIAQTVSGQCEAIDPCIQGKTVSYIRDYFSKTPCQTPRKAHQTAP